MFKKLAADALGLSDIGAVISPDHYDKVEADDYLFHEDGERIYFLIKSRKDEYCFTNLALVHVDGESAVSSKRAIRRYPWSSTTVGHVAIETAGTIDLDIELKFTLGEKTFSIDVRRSYIEQLKDIYKALISIGRQQARDVVAREHAVHALSAIGTMYKLPSGDPDAVARQFAALLDGLNTAVLDRHTTRDFGAVFEKYIRA